MQKRARSEPKSARSSWHALRWVLLGAVVILLGLAGVVLVRTLRFRSTQVRVAAVKHVALDREAVLGRLSGAIRLRTISHQDPARMDGAPFDALHSHLERSFPRVHRRLKRERFSRHSVLYTWTGSEPTLPPVLWLAHTDVVPVEAGGAQWHQPPFSGAVKDGFVWGRGTMDDKGQSLAMLEALEQLLSTGFAPRRTLLLALGHDEEVGGHQGAKVMAAALASRGVRPMFVLDEGLVITRNMVPGVKPPVAVVGIAEKGYVTLELTVKGKGGHSSMPPPHTAVGILAAAIKKLEDHPMPARLTGAFRQLFEAVGPEMKFFQRMAFANLWLFGSQVRKKLASKPATNALLRTTLAATVIQGSVKENVLPQRARALVNVRIHPQDSVAIVFKHARRVIADKRVKVRVGAEHPSEPTPPSRIDSAGYRLVARTIRQVFPGTLVAPGLMVAMTDSRHYRPLCKNIYRFAPIRITPKDRARFHGLNERISVRNYLEMINFYIQLAQNANR